MPFADDCSLMDCNGDCDGESSMDSCNVCSEGNTGHSFDSDIDCNGECFGIAIVDSFDTCCLDPAHIDGCGECGGNGSTCEGLWNVFYEVSIPFAGFQFNIDGASGISASGGAAEAAGFIVSVGSTTVIGFSLSGSTIPPGTGTLTSLEIAGNSNSFCIKDLVLSNISGDSIPAIIENCNTIKYLE